MSIAKNIYNLRKKTNLSQESLAEKIGVTRQTISNWESGISTPDLKQSKELSKIFNVTIDELADNEIKDVLIKKTSNIEKLAGITIKFIQIMSFLLIVAIAAIIFFANYFKASPKESYLIEYCKIDNQEKYYKIEFDKDGKIIDLKTDIDYLNKNISDITINGKFKDELTIINYIQKYIKEQNGICGITPSVKTSVK